MRTSRRNRGLLGRGGGRRQIAVEPLVHEMLELDVVRDEPASRNVSAIFCSEAMAATSTATGTLVPKVRFTEASSCRSKSRPAVTRRSNLSMALSMKASRS